MIITRFAPSPTGTLHIGSVRTILFNWLYAKANNGKFLLRIEDTDKERSKPEFVENIFITLNNLGLDYDDEVVYQSQREKRHQEVAYKLLKDGRAYKCYCTEKELSDERDFARAHNQTPTYSRKCRNLTEDRDGPFTIRLKTELTGALHFKDLIQGDCSVKNEHMDDMILLRSNGVPTYMFAVVIDDYDMNITTVIRGTEHLNNAYRQLQIYKACEFTPPDFAHVSLIHAEDGTKLSKRNGAKSVEEYQKEGFLKEAILNYLLRLGWSYGENEIISMQDCCKIFDIKNVRSSSARFSLDKMLNINSIYIRNLSNLDLVEKLQTFDNKNRYSKEGWKRVELGMDGLKSRSRTLSELLLMSDIYGYEDNYYEKIMETTDIKNIEKFIDETLTNPWNTNNAEIWLKNFLEKTNLKLKNIAPALRLAITKSKVSPCLFEILQNLGPDLVLKRLKNAITTIL
ncbi:glutamate--tRNA ligase [Alphaproteobacteria bacterium endosymbiont of Tiliacea citrago]|uniref:glutamate--tRNA ligase n=1 Tax=Alphaproteobacteria bacterium endosymbiont of Tiliacea citrago TaxID=3077944 RepID=UPI00313CB194